MLRLCSFASVLLLVPAAIGQSASYTLRPNSCDSYLPMQVQGLPRLGQAFTVSTFASTSFSSLHGFVIEDSILLTGVSDRSFAGLPLPYDLNRLGIDACGDLRVSMDILTPVGSGTYQQIVGTTFTIPNDPSLLGVQFHQQAMLRETILRGSMIAAQWLAFSASGHAVIGL